MQVSKTGERDTDMLRSKSDDLFGSGLSPSRDASLGNILQQRARYQPDTVAYRFLVDAELSVQDITYGELDFRARSIAAELQRRDAAGHPVLLLYAPGLAYIAALLGCFYAGALAVPVYPPAPSRFDRTFLRLRSIVEDACAKVVLTSREILAISRGTIGQDPVMSQLAWVSDDNLSPEATKTWQASKITPNDIAFLQYTSGSTGTPKGVILSHSNLIHNCRMIDEHCVHAEQKRGVIWLPPYHDMGLIGGILYPLYAGFPTVLMSPLHFLQRPLRWLEAISTYRASISAGPNFAYELCARKVTPEQVASLDLHSWRVAFNGAEPVRPETLQRFAEAFAPAGFASTSFCSCYGLAEATLIATGGQPGTVPITLRFDQRTLKQENRLGPAREDAPSLSCVSSGRPHPDQELVIVEPQTMVQCAPGHVGEIWLSGPCVARGYWRRDDTTRETFDSYLVDTGKGPYLRTGDLGALVDGELYLVGRIKDLIIVDGTNHHPPDIERTVEQCDARIRPGCCAAFSVEVNGEERLVIVYELSDKVSSDEREHIHREVLANIRTSVARYHELRLHDAMVLAPRTIPKTSSGKIQRHACKQEYLSRINSNIS